MRKQPTKELDSLSKQELKELVVDYHFYIKSINRNRIEVADVIVDSNEPLHKVQKAVDNIIKKHKQFLADRREQLQEDHYFG